MSRKLFRKVFVYISVFSIILQALAPFSYVQLNSKAYAQEVVTETPAPTLIQSGITDTILPTPTDTPGDTPTDTPVPASNAG